MRIIKKYMTQNDCFKAGKTIKPSGVMLHSTAAKEGEKVDSDYYYDRWNKPGITKCVHAFLDEENVTEMLPVTLEKTARGWHCGSSSNGSMNDTHICFEIIEPKDYSDKTYFEKVKANALEYCVHLYRLYKWGKVTEVNCLCHCEAHTKYKKASNHADIHHWWLKYHNYSMDDFRRDLQAMLDVSVIQAAPAVKKYVTVNTKEDNLNCRKAADTDSDILGRFKKGAKLELIAKDKDWYKVKGKSIEGKTVTGYCSAALLKEDVVAPAQQKKKYAIVNTESSNIYCRSKANKNGSILGRFKKGAKLDLISKTNDNWWKVSGSDLDSGKKIVGYCFANLLKEV